MERGFDGSQHGADRHPSPTAHAEMALLMLTICVIAPASLFLHDYMLESLKVPYPKFVGVPNWVKFVNEVVRLFTLAALCRLALPRLRSFSKATAAAGAGLFLVMLYETFRVWSSRVRLRIAWYFPATPAHVRRSACSWAGAAVTWIMLC